jgi:cell division transport system permease protein
MALYRIAYFVKKGFQLIRQNIYINIMAMGTVALSFLIFSVFFLVFQNLNSLLDLWEKRVQIIAYLADDLGENATQEIRRTLVNMSQVETVRFVSKEEAMATLKKNLGDQDQILEGFSADVLPASFEIQLERAYRSVEATRNVVSLLKKIDGISDIQYGQQWIERFSVFIGIYRFSTIMLGLLLSMAIAFIVSSAIKLSIYSRRDELEIMKLVGANSSFVKIPFYIEGGFQGILGSFVSLVILLLLYVLFLSELSDRLRFYNLFFKIHFLTPKAILSIILGGGALGFLGSFFSLIQLKEN